MGTRFVFSGAQVVRALQRAGWYKHSQVGSHAKMVNGEAHVTVPLHDHKRGTLSAILRTVGMTAEDLKALL